MNTHCVFLINTSWMGLNRLCDISDWLGVSAASTLLSKPNDKL